MDQTLSLLLRRIVRCAAFTWLCAWGAGAHAQGQAEFWVAEAQRFAIAQLATPGAPRFEVLPGALDARLRLTPCEKVQPYLPTGVKLLGQARVGVRCVKGVTPWNVYVPMTVNVYGTAMVSTTALPAGHVLASTDFRQAEVNLAEDKLNPPITNAALLVGRTLAKPLVAGQSLREPSLKARQWFTAGDRVRIRVAGSGFAVAAEGEAVTAGMEGQPARVRTESGRTVSGMPVAERLLEIAL